MSRYSFSGLSTYLDCHQRWFWQYLDRKPNTTYTYPQLRGSAIHATIEYYNLCRSLGVDLPTKQEMEQYYLRDYASRWGKVAPNREDEDEATQFAMDGIYMIHNAIDHVLPAILVASNTKGLPCIEEKWELALPNGHSMTGFIDTIALGPDDQRIVLDYKSKPRPKPPWYKRDVEDNLQVTLYCMADRESHGENGAVEAAYVFLGESEPSRIFAWTQRSFERQEQDILSVVKLVDTIEEAKRDYDRTQEPLLFMPSPGHLCGHCQFVYQCQTGMEWLFDHQKTPVVKSITTPLTTPLTPD